MIKDEVLEVALASPSDKADAVIEFSILGIPSAGDQLPFFSLLHYRKEFTSFIHTIIGSYPASCYVFHLDTPLQYSFIGTVSGPGAGVSSDRHVFLSDRPSTRLRETHW